MRPKKRILLVDADEDRLAVLRFVLRTHAFAVWGTTEASEAREILRSEYPEVLLLVWPLEEASVEALLRANDWQLNRSTVLLVAKSETAAPEITANQFLLGRDCTPAKVVEAAKFCARRKRGPRKKPASSFDPARDEEFWADLDRLMGERDLAGVAGLVRSKGFFKEAHCNS